MPSIRDEITRTLARFGKRALDQPASGQPSLRVRSEIGQYRVLRRLGAGGMGHVFLALDTKLGRHVALKVLSPQLTSEPAYVSRFQQEARAASALNHPNILTIYDFVEIEGAQIIVSEFIEGVTLRTALERGALELNQALDVISQVASALAAAHAAGVVHRDLKPTNIMIRPDGYVKVIDFGLAKLAERSSFGRFSQRSLTRPGTMVGTVRYMSPEQARGEEVDHRGDIWSLGIVLYETLAGIAPFEGTTDNHLIVAILDLAPKPLPEDKGLPAGLPDVLSRALAKNRKDRFQSASELQAAVQALQWPSGSQVTPRALSRRLPKYRWAYSAVLAIALIAVFVWWGPLGGRWRVRGPDWFEVGQTERLTYEGDVHRAALSPDGKWLAYTTGAQGSEVLHLKALLTSAERILPPAEQSYSGLTFSPDGSTLFFVLRDARQELGTLFSVPLHDFARTPQAMVLRDIDGPIAFSPNGQEFAFLRRKEMGSIDTASILVASINDVHQVRSIVSLRETQIYGRLSWSQQGIAAIVSPSKVGQPSQASIYLFDDAGKFQKRIASRNFRMLGSPVFTSGGRSLLVTALTQGALQARLEQYFLPTNEWHTTASDLAGFDDISTARNGELVGAVRSIARSSVWVLSPAQNSSPVRLTSETEYYPSLAWMNDGRLLVPSTRTGNLNLMTVNADGRMQPLLKPEAAFETDPATTGGLSDIVYSSNAAHGGDEFNIWTVRPGQRQPVLLTSGSNADLGPQLTPDGKWAIYTSSISGAQTLWRVPLKGGTPESVSKYRARKPFISPDGKSLVCEIREADGDWKVAILSVANGEVVRQMPTLPIGGIVRWSRDGSALDYISHEGNTWVIRRQPIQGGNPTELVRSPEQKIVYFAWTPDGSKLAYIASHVETDAVLLHRAPRH